MVDLLLDMPGGKLFDLVSVRDFPSSALLNVNRMKRNKSIDILEAYQSRGRNST